MTGATLTHNSNIAFESTVNIEGYVTIDNGATHIECKNKMTGVMMAHWVSMIAGHNWSSYTPQNYRWNGVANNFCVLGFDQTHPTTYATTALNQPIGFAPGTKPQSMKAATSGNSTTGEYYLTYLFTYPVGYVEGTVGEIGMYWITSGGLVANNGSCGATTTLNSRISVADGEFTPFLIDPTQQLTVTWTYKFSSDGKVLKPFLYNILNACTSSWDSGDYTLMSRSWASKTTYMVIGQNTTTGNNITTTTALTSPIGTAPGTIGNTQSLTTTNPSNGVYKCTWTSTWNANTLAAGLTLGEIGIYLYGRAQLDAMYFAGQGQGAYFSARLSSADGHFTSQTIDQTKALIIAWTITFTFT